MRSWEFRFLNVTQIGLIDQKKASWFKIDFCVNCASYNASYNIDDRPFCLQNFALLSMFVLFLFLFASGILPVLLESQSNEHHMHRLKAPPPPPAGKSLISLLSVPSDVS